MGSGLILSHVLNVIESLFSSSKGINVISFAMIKPFPTFDSYSDFVGDSVLIIQELSESSGIDADISLQFLKNEKRVNSFNVVAPRVSFATSVGDVEHVRSEFGIDYKSIYEKIKSFVES